MTPPSPCTGSTSTAAVLRLIVSATSSISPYGMCKNPGVYGPNPFWYLIWPVAVMVVIVLPWKEFFMAIISPFPVCFRASFIAPSFASAPLLQKKTF